MLKNRLKQIRLNMAAEQGRDITQTEFAELIGIDRNLLNRYEQQKKQPSLELAFRISMNLKCTVNDIFDYIPE